MVSVLITSSVAYAHEIYYTGTAPNGTKIVLKWKWKNSAGTKIELNCSDDYMGSFWGAKYTQALGRWNIECGTDISLLDHSFSGSKVDMMLPTDAKWVEIVGSSLANYTYAYTKIQDDAGTYLTSPALAQASSSKLIKYAVIYFNPRTSVQNQIDSIEKSIVIVHELGHVMCLGHSNDAYYPTTADSIMENSLSTISSDSPTTHDVTDIHSKY